MKTDKTIIGILGGLAAGALLGILFAPDKGSNTRKKIKRKSSKYATDAKDKAGDVLESLSQKYDNLKADGMQYLADRKEQLSNGIENAKN
ncbi:YtxH domain-containing protein [Flavobacterium sp.]|uniref:YtxH domain-containing protein n=1 Tax=Flavobacterium sp. TaxID=239 RepID=UPI002612D0FC|nr:YtxH domain-containing protein [Flavobacterium sp.]MDG2431729.1 YtxH domain-containing protein [Flavobacterium sp.]